MAKSKTEMEVNIGANIKELVKAIEEAKKLISSLSDSFKQGLKLAVDVKNIKSEIRDVKNEIKSELIAKPFKVNVEVDSNKLKSNIKTALREAIKEINTQGINSKLKLPTAPKMKVTVDTSSARTSIRNLKNMLQKNQVRINTGKAEGDIIRLSTYMNQLASKKVTPQIDTSKAEQAKLSIAELATYMNQLQSKKIKIDISFSNKDIVNNLKDIDSLLKSIQKNSNIKLNVNATGRASGGGGVQSQIQQYRTLRQEARHFALEAEKAWTAGNKQGFEQNRQNFLVAMKDLADFSRQLGNLSASKEAGMYSNMLRSLQQTSPLYNDILNKIKQLKQEQKDFNNLINEGNKKLKLGGGGLRQNESQQRLPGFAQGTVGASAYAIHYLGRSSKGFGSFGEATAQFISDLDSMGSAMHKVAIPVAALAGTVAITVTAFTAAIKGIELFGGLLKQIGQEVYNALKPGIDLYKQQTSAFFSFTASLMSNGMIGSKETGYTKLLDMQNGMDIAMGLSNKLLQKAQIDAEMSAFSLQDILASLQGTLPMLMSKGMTMEQAYDINKGVAAVAKMIQLTPSQILQETRDLAQGSITSRGTQVANALHLTNADLKKYEGKPEELYGELMKRFSQYDALLQRFEDTAIGRFQQLEERWQTVARSMIEGMLPQFKGAFEELINATGKWVATSGTYIDKFGNEVELKGTASLDALTGKWKDASGEILNDFKVGNVHFELEDTLKELQQILPEIIQYIADMIDRIISYIEEETGITDPLKVAEALIIEIVDWFEISVKFLVDMVKEADTFSIVLFTVYNVVKVIIHAFGVLFNTIKFIASELEVVLSIANEITSALGGNVEGARAWRAKAEVRRDKAWDSLKKSSVSTIDDITNLNWSFDDVKESLLNELKNERNGSFTKFGDAIRKKSEEDKLGKKTTDKSMKDAVGEMSKEDDKARKKAIKDAQRDMKEHIKGLKEALKDHIEELKEALNKNKIAFDEGFMSIREYYEQKAQIEAKEAQARLKEAQEEREWILKTPYENQADQLRALHTVNREIREYTRAVQKTTQVQKEVAEITRQAFDNFGNLSNLHDNLFGDMMGNVPLNAQTTTGMSNTEVLYRQLTQGGLEDAMVRGIIASLMGESGRELNTGLIGDNGTSYGIAQWHDERWTALKDFAIANSSDISHILTQGANLLREISSTESRAFAQVLDYYNNNGKTAEAATYAFTKFFERPNDREGQGQARKDNLKYVNEDLENASNVAKSYVSNFSQRLTEEINKYLGMPYYLGNDLSKGIDCSKFVQEVYKGLGIEIARTADDQARAFEDLGAFFLSGSNYKPKKGDSVFMYFGGDYGTVQGQKIGHTGIYNGDGTVTHASSGRGQVVTVPISDLESGIVGYGDLSKYAGVKVGNANQVRMNRANTGETSSAYLKSLNESIKRFYDSAANLEALQLNKLEAQIAKINADLKAKLDSSEVQGLEGDMRDKYIQQLTVMAQKQIADLTISVAERTLNYNLSKIEDDFDAFIDSAQTGRNSFSQFESILSKYFNYFYNTSGDGGGEQNGIWGVFKYIETITREAEFYLTNGMNELYQQAMQKVKSAKEHLKNMVNKPIERIDKIFSTATDLFTTSDKFTSLQKEFGERELKAMQGQAEYDYYSGLENNLRQVRNQKIAELEKYKNGMQDTKLIERELLDIDKQLWDTTMAKEKAKLISEQYPDYLRDLKVASKQALEDGLVTFLTDGITEAESLEDALLDLAKTVLKEIQKVSAKHIVKSLMNNLFGGWNVDEQESLHLNASQGLDIELRQAGNNVISALNDIAIGIRNSSLGLGGYTNASQPGMVESNLVNNSYMPYQNTFTLSALQNSQFGANSGMSNNYSFDYASLGIQKLGESANTVGQQALPSLTQNLTNSAQTISNETASVNIDKLGVSAQTASATIEGSLQQLATYISTSLTEALTNLATQAGNAASALSSIGGDIPGMAVGGLIKGPGTSKSDDIPTMLSNGEFVVKASSVRKYGTNFLNALNEGKLGKIKSKVPHFAEGGLINSIAQDGTARGVSSFGKNMASNINNTANISVALVRDEQEGVRQLLKSPEGQKIMLDFSRKFATATSKF